MSSLFRSGELAEVKFSRSDISGVSIFRCVEGS